MAQGGSNRKVANGIVAAGTAAVLAVYAAGYSRTQSAANQLEAQSSERHPVAAPESDRPARGPLAEAPPVSAPTVSAPDSTPAAHKELSPPQQVSSLDRPALVAPPPALPTLPEQKTETSAPQPSPVPTAPPSVAIPAPAATVVTTPAPAAPAPAQPAAAKYKDGTYKGWGTCRHGDIEAEVVIEGGRITSASISQCLTRYSCDIIGRLPPQVVQRQSAEVDYVTGATQSANAFYYAVLEALGKAK